MLLRKSTFWLAICVVVAFITLAYPMFVMWPFRSQGAQELAVALVVVRFQAIASGLLVAASLILFVRTWQQSRRTSVRSAALVSVLLVIGFGLLGRMNTYELMFHPVERPSFSAAAESKLASNEEVIAVRIRGQARAYPVRSMSYHHIVNDTMGGLPIVATY